MREVSGDAYERRIIEDVDAGLPRSTADKLAAFCALRHALDIIDISLEQKRPASLVAEVYFSLSHLLDISWMNQQVRALKSDTVWHDRSRFSLGLSLRGLQSTLTASALATSRSTSAGKLIDSWTADREATLNAVREMTRSLRSEPHTDASMLSVLVGEMDRLN